MDGELPADGDSLRIVKAQRLIVSLGERRSYWLTEHLYSQPNGVTAVYKGIADGQIGRVAVKLLNRDYTESRRCWEGWKFSNEVACAKHLRDVEGVRSLEDYGELAAPPRALQIRHGAWVLVYEYDEYTLRDVLRGAGGTLELSKLPTLLRCLAPTLHRVHQRGIVHRDIKPENILVPNGDLGKARLGDFGVALTRRNRRDQFSSKPVGTLGYRAPEQKISPSRVTHRADLYSLAAVVWECICGRVPDEAISQRLKKGRRHLNNVQDELERALSPSRATRHSSVLVFLRDLLRAGEFDGVWEASPSDSPRLPKGWSIQDYRGNKGSLWLYAPERFLRRIQDATPTVLWQFAVKRDGRSGFYTKDRISEVTLRRKLVKTNPKIVPSNAF
jgi:serine/threonine protein kinase